MNTPEGIKQHEASYKPNAWEEYTIQELGTWVHLLAKRSRHRASDKKRKDLADARNYLAMIGSHLDALEGK